MTFPESGPEKPKCANDEYCRAPLVPGPRFRVPFSVQNVVRQRSQPLARLISIIGPPASGKATLAEQWRGDFVHRVIKALT